MIDDGAVIAAGAVVTRHVEANTLVAEIPACVLKTAVSWS
jgi:acetyltransferase-like isoleucine patch superfamily enzyme